MYYSYDNLSIIKRYFFGQKHTFNWLIPSADDFVIVPAIYVVEFSTKMHSRGFGMIKESIHFSLAH